jgi:hypothetical protein
MGHLARIGLSLLVSCTLAACGGGSPVAPTPTAAASPAPSPSSAPTISVLRSATLRGASGHSTSGTAQIEREGTGHLLRLNPDFRIDSGNTDVYLARSAGSVDAGDLNLGELRMLTGEQTYSMPHDGGQYSHVVLWCRPFRVTIGVGELR